MKIERLETHDRLQHFVKEDFDIGKICQNIIDKRPFGNYPFYIFAHSRTIGMDEKIAMFNSDLNSFLTVPFYVRKYESLDKIPEKKIIWQPRLTKPKCQSNSMLFKVTPGSDTVKVIWMIPAEELWSQYRRGNITENALILSSIEDFKNNKQKLEAKEDDDLSDMEIDAIYMDICKGSTPKKPFTLENI